MIINTIRNVCMALPAAVLQIQQHGREEDSRAGSVLVLPAPLVTVTSHPRERVLRSPTRDANPFFHCIEAIWMLAGREDATSLNRYVKDFGERYAEHELDKIHDAYGRRWRSAFGFDQLDTVIQRLIENPQDRQCVISMWDASRRENNDLYGTWRTRPCNTHIYLRVRDELLDMTVCCRSNDIIWGLTGSNAVHFSILQEYLAARIDVGIGMMYQLSNNAHIYVSEMQRLQKRAGSDLIISLRDDPYTSGLVQPMPMFTEPSEIDNDIDAFMNWHDTMADFTPTYANEWFQHTATRMAWAYKQHREKSHDAAIETAHAIRSLDWRLACVEWLTRRMFFLKKQVAAE